jgi:hypothetical protein
VAKPESQSKDAAVDTDSDRYPLIADVCRRLVTDLEDAQAPVERVEINTFADGSATYRVWSPRVEDAQGGYLAVD